MNAKDQIKQQMKQFIKDRDEAILSLDKDKIMEYLRKYNMEGSKPEEEIIFWAGTHKAVLGIRSATDEQKEYSRKWLRENGFKTDLDYGHMDR